MRTCNKCNRQLSNDCFSKKAGGRDGLQPSCKECYSRWHKLHYQKTRDDKLTKVSARYKEKTPEILDYARKWRRSNALHIEFYEISVKGRKNEANRRRRMANTELFRARERAYRSLNPGVNNAKVARRRARLLQCYPKWADDVLIRFVYTTRRWITIETGFVWHVDHLVPLQNKRVCGLHVHFNLRVVPATYNLTKLNHFEVQT